MEELKYQSRDKTIKRFISTHPDDDHIRGLECLNQPPHPEKVTLMTFIRHSTHHPENPCNDEYSPDKEGNRDVD